MGWIGFLIADHATQTGESLAQILMGLLFALVGPKKRHQHAAQMRSMGFHGQVGQQGQHLLRLRAHHDRPVHQHLRRTEKVQHQAG